jgi:hypothetical protein
MPHFASGKYANAICDICGVRCKYSELRETTIRGRRTGLLTCPTCWDPDHPQNFLPEAVHVLPDAVALRDPRPDTGKEASRRLYPPGNWPPFPPAPSASISEIVQRPGFRSGDTGGNS